MTFVGCDPDQLKASADAIRAAAVTIHTLAAATGQRFKVIDWQGADRESYDSRLAELQNSVRVCVAKVEDLAFEVFNAAIEQNTVSESLNAPAPSKRSPLEDTAFRTSSSITRQFQHEIDNKELVQRLMGAEEWEFEVMDDLLRRGMTEPELAELLRGGHVRIPGPGLFDQWTSRHDFGPRWSSHYEGNTEGWHQGKIGPLFGQMLIGKTQDGFTWVQMERNTSTVTSGDLNGLYDHMQDFDEYKDTGENQGPMGTSKRGESNAITLLPDQLPDASTFRGSGGGSSW